MMILNWLLTILLVSRAAVSDQNSLPVTFSEKAKIYSLVQSTIFDLDKILEESGLNVYACRLLNGSSAVSYRGGGACIYESTNFTFEQKKSSTIQLWVLNSQGQYLPPLIVDWKNSHSGWMSLVGGEFLYMKFESFFGLLVKKIHNISLPKGVESDCRTEMPNRDLGNFIGDLVIRIPKGRNLSEYYVPKIQNGIVETIISVPADILSLNVQMPTYIKKKRTYQVKVETSSLKSESINLSLVTNYNFVSPRIFKKPIEEMTAANAPDCYRAQYDRVSHSSKMVAP